MNEPRIEISVDQQRLELIEAGEIKRSYLISTAAKGVGSQDGSYRTPTGHFQIAEKIGNNAPPDTIFKGRLEHGTWDGCACDDDLVLTRILWLDGLEAGNQNTKARYIYIHGTNHEDRLGSPASCGCIRMAAADIMDLYNHVTTGTQVTIHPPQETGGKLIFFDCDSTLSSIEGIDELARARGPEVFEKVEALTNSAMNGEIPIEEVFPRRMEIIQPTRELGGEIAELYIKTITPGTRDVIAELQREGWTIVILSGGFEPLIRPLAEHLDIQHVEAVPLTFDDEGNYESFDADYPTTRNGGKPEIIRDWKNALLPAVTVMVGDGISDLESQDVVDLFVGYGGVVARPSVKQDAALWIEAMADLPAGIAARTKQ